MSERPWLADGFSHEEQAIIDKAYEAALVLIDDPDEAYAAIPPDVRHRCAAQAVFAEARQGKLEHRRLKGAALTALVPLLPTTHAERRR